MFFNKLSGYKQVFKGYLYCFCLLLGIHIALYAFLRLFFYVWNYSQLKSLIFTDILLTFVQGARFDLAVTGPISVLIIIGWIFLPHFLKYIYTTLVLLVHTALILMSIADTEVINFMGRRFTLNSLYLIGEGKASNMLIMYPLFIFAALILSLYFYFVFKILARVFVKHIQSLKNKTPFYVKICTSIFLLIFAVIFGRGGFQEKPISFINSKIINHPFAHQLVLNSAFTFIKSIGRDQVERVHFFEKQEDVLSLLNLNSDLYTHQKISSEKKNIVIFIVESLSSEYLNEKNTPFLVELSKRGVLFNPAYANGRRSVEGIAAILSGIPALMEESFINSEYATNDFVGLGTLLKTKGYYTSFFHGAQNGSMRFDSFTKAAGFDHYFGKTEFSDDSQDDHAWGIYDNPFLNFACNKMNSFPENFSSIIFTLTSHVPYHLPEDYKERIRNSDLKNEEPIIKSIHYTDFAIKNFFDCAKNQPWFKNTIFIITGDHTGPSLNPEATFKSKFEIPILFYTEEKSKLQNISNLQLAQQIDILPTVTDLIGVPLLAKNHLARSLFDPGKKMIALFSDQKYEVVTDIDHDTKKNEERLKAVRQYFSQGLYDNRLYYPRMTGK